MGVGIIIVVLCATNFLMLIHLFLVLQAKDSKIDFYRRSASRWRTLCETMRRQENEIEEESK